MAKDTTPPINPAGNTTGNPAEKWTEEMVIHRLEEAARVVSMLPAVKASGYIPIWPSILYTELERYRMDKKPYKPSATADQVTRMEEACEWLSFLHDVDDRKLLWLRANHLPWKAICWEMGLPRSTASKRYKNSIRVITQKLASITTTTKG